MVAVKGQDEDGTTAANGKSVEMKTRKETEGGNKKFWMFNDVRVFTAVLFTILVVYTSVYSFTVAILVTLERRYGLTAKQQSYISTANGVATMCTIPFVSHFLGNPTNHRPRWLGLGTILIGASYLVGSLPHFLSAPYAYDRAGNISSRGPGGSGLCGASPTSGGAEDCDVRQVVMSEDNEMAYNVFFISHICTGIGYGFIATLAFSYIDDFAGQRSSVYLGMLDGTWGIGLPVGFAALSMASLTIYVDFNRVDMADINIDESDPRWIGAWWVVGMVGGPIIILLSVPLFFFPKRLSIEQIEKREDETNTGGDDDDDGDDDNAEIKQVYSKRKMILYSVKGFFLATWRLLRNPVFMLVSLAYTINSPFAFGLFMPKYIQKDLGYTLATANLITGLLWLFPNFPMAIFLGWMMKKFKITVFGLVKLLIAFVTVIIITNGSVIALPCEGPHLVGSRSEENMVVGCNSGCDCELDHYQPVCGSNGLNYYSPCYAGCSTSISDKNFTDCPCINSTHPADTFAQDGLCPIPSCQYFVAFMVLLTVFSLCNSGMSLPTTMTVVRSVDKEQKSFALGLKHVISSLFRVPATMVAGAVIDYTCIVWREECGERGACAQYDNMLYRVLILSMTAGLSVVSLTLLLVALTILIRRRKRQGGQDLHSDSHTGTNGSLQLKDVGAGSDNQSFKQTPTD